jgi:hypothetical protein
MSVSLSIHGMYDELVQRDICVLISCAVRFFNDSEERLR